MLPMIRRNPWLTSNVDETFGRLRQELDSMFDRSVGTDGGSLVPSAVRAPLSVWEDEDHFYVEADLPGVAEADVEVTVHKGVLHLRAERKPEEGRTYLYNGRPFGRFERVVNLPSVAATDLVEATMSNGVLRVRLPKASEAKPRRIAVQKS